MKKLIVNLARLVNVGQVYQPNRPGMKDLFNGGKHVGRPRPRPTKLHDKHDPKDWTY